MERPTERRLFDDETGCLTDGALAGLMEGSLDELQRLEVSEHLSYCDACVERYTALLADGVLLEAPELMKQSVLAALRRKAAKVFVNRYFHMAVAASLTLVLWGSGVFNSFGEVRLVRPPEARNPEASISWRLNSFASDVSDGVTDFMDQLITIDLRGALRNEKE
ncbi:MAG: hypothetical protein HFF15_04290 [Angelakisella sp.]|jgi:hypothetical protein|nr:hypothetical protein [Angelakisella sp.]